jgi:hypothetical protein
MYLWRHLSTEAISIYGETRSQGVNEACCLIIREDCLWRSL